MLQHDQNTASGRNRTAWLIAGAVVGLSALAIGVAAGFWFERGEHSAPAAASAPPRYSMATIGNACDLVDPAPLAAWAPTPRNLPEHEEIPPAADSAGSLRCHLDYTAAPDRSYSFDRADLLLEVEFTNGSAPPFYDHWKHADTVTHAGPGTDSGPLTDVGTQGYWHWENTDNLTAHRAYAAAAQDGNVSVRVRIGYSREDKQEAASWAELGTIARAQVRSALAGLRTR